MNKTTQLYALLAATAIASTATVQANLIMNGGFETINNGQPTPTGYDQGGGTWGKFFGTVGDKVDGWDATGGPIELGLPTTYGVSQGTGPSLGKAVLELDSDNNVVVGQIFAASPTTYTLSFYYAQRSGVSAASGKFMPLWNGVPLELSDITPSSSTMTLYTKTVSAVAGNNTLSFAGRGTSDSFGVLIDNVVVVPETSTYVAGGLALLPLLFGLRSRFAKK